MPKDEAAKCKLRFKGVENFLRRVAFNLGNTPSQTEVKIISCIPIDVTDLQQKIVQLERQLEDTRNTKEATKDEEDENVKERPSNGSPKRTNGAQKATNGSKRPSTIHTALCTPAFRKFPNPGNQIEDVACCLSKNSIAFNNNYLKQRNPGLDFILSNNTSINGIDPSLVTNQSNPINEKNNCAFKKHIRQNIFKKNKKIPKNNNNSHIVYYTETNYTPFRDHGIAHAVKEMPYVVDKAVDQNYLSNMMQKQYQLTQAWDEFSDTSHFTSPVCRDVVDKDLQQLYESDMCFCCQGEFQDIDQYLRKMNSNSYSTLVPNRYDKRSTYYDSSLYDLIPVKEKPVNTRKEHAIPKRKELKIDVKCWPENVRVKPKYQPFIVNYHTIIPNKNERILPSKYNKRRRYNNIAPSKERRYINKLNQQTGMESSKSCLVEFEKLNSHPLPKPETVKLSEDPKLLPKNVECLTTTVDNSDCQTSALQQEISGTENKTDITLNQIKTILQSVLTEVKTNSQMKTSQEKTKKHAFVQNEPSQNNMQEKSSFLNSFTYSPYNMNPYGPSCSKQVAPNCMSYPGMQPVNFSQNYPVIVQGMGRHICTGCFRTSQSKTCPKITTTAATNTDDFQEQRSKETAKLIQEIYKSVALGMPTKDTSFNEYNDLQLGNTKAGASNPPKQDREVKLAISDIFKNRNVELDTSRTRDTITTINSKTSKTNSTRSRLICTDISTDNQVSVKIRKSFLSNKNIQLTTETEPETEREITPHSKNTKPKKISTSTVSESSDSENSSDTQSEDTVISAKPKVKKRNGLFGRMFQIFQKNKNRIKEETEPDDPDTSDSDDYQTIYSDKSELPKDSKRVTRRTRVHSKILNSRHVHKRSPERPKRAPYMEQEHRRYWNEDLMFHNQKSKYSSEKPFSRDTPPRLMNPYHQSYEARSVLVDPHRIYRPQHNQPRVDYLSRDNITNDMRFTFGQQRNIPYKGDYGNFRTGGNIKPGVYNNIGNKNQYPIPRTVVANRNTKVDEAFHARNKNPAQLKPKGISWFKKHKMGLRCGEHWKQFILES